jgi:hypothetical protein
MDTDYKKRLKRHIKALDTAYENIITILEEDVKKESKKEGEDEKIALKDDKIKTYADGLEKAAKTANYLLTEIKTKQEELDLLNKPKKNSKQVEDEEVIETTQDHQLEKHLE